MTTAPKPRRRWLQFRLRTLLLVTALLCVPLAWVAWKMDQKRQERAVIAALRHWGEHVKYDGQDKVGNGTPPGPTWLRWLLGDDWFAEVKIVVLNDSGRVSLVPLAALDSLDLKGRSVNDFDLVHLLSLPALQHLDLSDTSITDAGVVYLMKLRRLTDLRLENTQVTEAGVAALREALPNCEIIQ